MRVPFFQKNDGQKPGLVLKNSNVSGNVSIDVNEATNGSAGLDLYNSNIVGNITMNFNGGLEALEQKVDSVLSKLDRAIEHNSESSNVFSRDFQDVKDVAHQKNGVTSVIDSMQKLARVLYKSGYYEESTEVQIQIAEVMIETDSVVTRIRGMIHLCKHDKASDWYEHMRTALKLAVENNLKNEEYLVHYSLFDFYFAYGKNEWQLRNKSKRLMDDIVRNISYMAPKSFVDAYSHVSSWKSDIVFKMCRYMTWHDSRWRKSDERHNVKRLISSFDALMKNAGCRYDKHYKEYRFELLHPKVSRIVNFPGFCIFCIIFVLTFFRYEPGFVHNKLISWPLFGFILFTGWYFLI